MISAIIVDDELDARKNVRKHLLPYADKVKIIAEAQNVDEAVILIKNEKVDLIFLDIAMPRKSGFDLLQMIPEFKGEVIFVTSFNQHAEEAFKFLALGYLIKPLDQQEFSRTIKKTIEIIELKKNTQSYKHLLTLMQSKNTNSQKIVVPVDGGLEVLQTDLIYYLKGERNYTNVFYKDKHILVSKNLSKIEQWLNTDTFMRIHRSYIVNMNKVSSIRNDGFVVLDNKTKINVAKSMKAELALRLSNL